MSKINNFEETSVDRYCLLCFYFYKEIENDIYKEFTLKIEVIQLVKKVHVIN